jgi:hypothetical protein
MVRQKLKEHVIIFICTRYDRIAELSPLFIYNKDQPLGRKKGPVRGAPKGPLFAAMVFSLTNHAAGAGFDVGCGLSGIIVFFDTVF